MQLSVSKLKESGEVKKSRVGSQESRVESQGKGHDFVTLSLSKGGSRQSAVSSRQLGHDDVRRIKRMGCKGLVILFQKAVV